MSRPLSPELTLAIECCRWPLSPEAVQAIRRAAKRTIDWDRLDAIISRNRIRPLVHHGLSKAEVDLPDGFRRALLSYAKAVAVRALALARESIRLQKTFTAHGIPVLIMKGVPLEILAYGELGMKESVDIDLLVGSEQAADARRLLIGLGYEPQYEKGSEGEFDIYAEHANEAPFVNTASQMKVDLHWKLIPHRGMLAGVGLGSPTQVVDVGGKALRTLADEPLFAYLCVHGVLHNWSRLKWLADVAALLAARTEAEVARLYEAAQAYQVGRCASVTLLLCRQLFGVRLDERLVRTIEKDRIARALVRNTIWGLAHRGGKSNERPYSWLALRMIAAHFFMARGLSHQVEQLGLIWNSPIDRARIQLPRGFEIGHHVLRIPLWLGRVASRLLRPHLHK